MAIDFSNSNANIREAFCQYDHNAIISLINNYNDANGYHDYYHDGFAYYNLYLASRCRNIEPVKHLISKGAEINQVSGHLRWTALHVAAFNGSFNIVKYLLDSGADSEIKDTAGHTAGDLAEQQGNHDVVVCIETHVFELVKGVHCESDCFDLWAKKLII